jgi:uncharacterized delta-60 repeat protein
VQAVALDDQNRILAVGQTGQVNAYEVALVRYNANGFRDMNFGVGGRVTEGFGVPTTWPADVVVQDGGRIVVLATAFQSGEVGAFAMAAYDEAGVLDPDFGVGGRVMTSLGVNAYAHAGRLLVQDDGKLVATGDAGEGRLAAIRYAANGSPDGTFGPGGARVISPPGAGVSGASGAVLQDDGRILIAGATEGAAEGWYPDFAVVRLQADAAPSQQMAVTSLTLMNAITDQPIMTLTNGAVLDLASLPAQVNVRGDVGGGAAGSVRFGLDANPAFKIESTAPFALFGNTGSDYWPGTFAAGSHTLTATPFTGSGATGAAGIAKAITFQVIAPAPAAALTYTLVNAATNQDVMPLTEGTVLNLATLPPKLNVRADSPSAIGSVRFGLDGNSNVRVESVQPYALFGDSGTDYADGTFATGSHALTGTPFSGANATGVAGAASTIHFQVINQPVITTLALMNAQTDQPLLTLTDGALLDLSVLGTTHFNVRADTAPATVGSVWFSLDGTIKIENTKPYALFGNSGNDYNDGSLALGNHTLTLRAYSKSNATGTAGPIKTINFTVVP